MPLLPSLPEQTALGPALRRFPIADNALLAYRSALMFPGEPLGIAECELIATYVSALNDCGYCVGSHRVVAEAAGIEPVLLAAILDDPDAVTFEADIAPLLALVAGVTRAPSQVEASQVSDAVAAGWSEDQVAHAVAVCAFFNGVNRIADGTGIERRPPDVTATRRRVASRRTVRCDATDALLRHHAGLMRGPSPLSIGEREMLACLTSTLNRCRRGTEAHRAAAVASGVATETMAAMIADPHAPPDGRIAPLAAYVRILTATPGAVGPGEAQAVFEAGWGEAALFHAISVCALANLLNRLIGCPGMDPDPAIAALYQPLPGSTEETATAHGRADK